MVGNLKINFQFKFNKRFSFPPGKLIKTKSLPIEKFDTFIVHDNTNLIGAKKENDTISIFSLNFLSNNSPKIKFKFESVSFSTFYSMAICKSGAFCFLGSNDKNFFIDVFETKYSVKIGSLKIKNDVLPKSFQAIDDNLFITCKNNIILLPVCNQKLLLSQLLTKSLSIPGADNNIKTRNNKKFKDLFKIPDNDEPLTLDKMKEINNKLERNLFSLHEEMIVTLLDFCTKHYLQLKNSVNEDQLIEELRTFFNNLIKIPYNEIFLISCLKSSDITIEQYLLSIDLLIELVPLKDCSTVTWISIILDANYNKFIIKPGPETIETLNKIYDRVCKCIEFYQELGVIKTKIESLEKHEKRFINGVTRESRPIGQYCIELLTFT